MHMSKLDLDPPLTPIPLASIQVLICLDVLATGALEAGLTSSQI
jgi:hypothetical protein